MKTDSSPWARAVVVAGLSILVAGCGGDSGSVGGGSDGKPRRNARDPSGTVAMPEMDPGRAPPSATPAPPTSDPAAGIVNSPPSGTGTARSAASAQAGQAGGPVAEGARPQDVTQWEPEHFMSAKVDRAAELVAAVEHLGKKPNDDKDAAKTLVQLLTIDAPAKNSAAPPTQPAPGGGPAGYEREAGIGQPGGADQPVQVDANVAKAVIVALASNNTPPAHTALKNLLSGKLKSPLSQQDVVTQVSDAMAANLNSSYEDIFFTLLTRPQSYAKTAKSGGGQGRGLLGLGGGAPSEERFDGGYSETITPEWVQQESLRAAGPVATSKLRVRLAEFLQDPKVVQELAQPLEKYLAEQDPKNISAQLILFRNQHTDPSTREGLERFMTAASTGAVGHLLGIPEGTDPESAGAQPGAGRLDPRGEEPYGPSGARPSSNSSARPSLRPTRDQAEGRGSPNPSGGVNPFGGGGPGGGGLAGALAPKSMGPLYVQMAQKLWAADMAKFVQTRLGKTDSLESAGGVLALAGTMPLDPVRQTLRELIEKHRDLGPQPWSAAGLLGQRPCDPAMLVLIKGAYHEAPKSRSRGRSRSRVSSRNDAAADPTAGRTSGGSQNWATETESFVERLGRMFHAAAKASKKESGSSQDDGEQTAGPVELHAGANVVARYHLQWPEEAKGKVGRIELAPLNLHYVRIEQEERARSMMSHYKRQARGAEIHQQSDKVWLDALGPGSAEGTQLSTDIRMAVAGTVTNAGPNDEVPLVIEVLTIEIPDPDSDSAAE